MSDYRNMQRYTGSIPRECVEFMDNYLGGRYCVNYSKRERGSGHQRAAEIEADRMSLMWEGWLARGKYEDTEGRYARADRSAKRERELEQALEAASKRERQLLDDLSQMAKQKTADELREAWGDDDDPGDWEEAYDAMVRQSRAILATHEHTKGNDS